MKVIGYKESDYSAEIGEYEVLVNPDNYKDKAELRYSSNSSPIGTSMESVKFRGAGAHEFEINFFFDGTGVMTKQKVDDQINQLKSLIFTYNGDIHEPNYVKIFWGTQFLFQGRLKTWQPTYTMMDPDGTPLRAEIACVFIYSITPKKKALLENKNSSDLTHIREVKMGDHLPAMCYKIYGESKYYIQVARYNGISNFRSILPGDQIIFPPII
ncbi:CIS tube protein [Algoriphagus aquimarinus]|nr:LysM peptidoglycan-binding domain-containing protein [Algoriphagus aquimarinus]